MSEASIGARPPEFDISRRGYDRATVDRWAAEAVERIEALQRERDALAAQLTSLGLKDSVDLQAEIEAISGEVARILNAARSAADGMRSRAAEDAAEWQTKARTEAAATRAAATADAELMRGSAWDTSTELLEKVRAEAEAQVRTARQDVLVVRAEAEQDAHRLVAGARKEMDEKAKASRLESERTLAAAKAESEKMIENARLEAEAAQERAAALEQRRGELMAELEEARAAIAALETDLETRREALKLDPAEDLAESTTVRVIDPTAPEESWVAEESGVRILPGGVPGPPEPVDADAMAAEVRRMRQEVATPPVAKLPAAEPEPEAAVDEEPAPSPEQEPTEAEAAPDPAIAAAERASAEAEAPAAEADTPVAEAPVAEPLPEPEEDDSDVAAEADADAEGEEPAAPEAAVEETDAEPAGAPESAGLDSLFARLRGGPGEVNGDEPASEPQPPPAESPPAEAPPEPPEPAEAPAPAAVAVAVDVFELRDRMLLPITNRALREVKRVILDLQNGALEELRVEGDSWRPQAGTYQQALHDALATVPGESRLAGAEAAAELTGVAVAVAPPAEQLSAESVVAMALADAVTEVVERAAGSGAGQRSTSAAVSRVFRAWRSDEAERRLRSMSHGAYHAGLLAALAAAGVPRVVGQTAGIPCAECPAGSGEAWDPAGAPPHGTVVPPALVDCACTLVPAGS